MKIAEYKKTIKHPLLEVTGAFLVKDRHVLLGLKKTGFGQGNWVGIGGKVDPGETAEEAAFRELQEEIRIRVTAAEYIGNLSFYFPYVEGEKWNMRSHIFVIPKWEGEPSETDAMKPQWFRWEDLPFNQMWDDARYWMPFVQSGTKFEVEFSFNKDLKVHDHSIHLK